MEQKKEKEKKIHKKTAASNGFSVPLALEIIFIVCNCFGKKKRRDSKRLLNDKIGQNE